MSRKRNQSFWTYQSCEPTPSHSEAVALGAFKGSEADWFKLSPGFRREIVRTTKHMKAGA